MKALIEYLWKDRKRHLGLPLSFTQYQLSEDRIFCIKGILNIQSEEVLLYRVRDISLRVTLFQRLFGTGTICIESSDKSSPHLDLRNVRHPWNVKELIHHSVEAAKEKRRLGAMEVMGAGSGGDAHENCELGDFLE